MTRFAERHYAKKGSQHISKLKWPLKKPLPVTGGLKFSAIGGTPIALSVVVVGFENEVA